jgi:hypothetical protein
MTGNKLTKRVCPNCNGSKLGPRSPWGTQHPCTNCKGTGKASIYLTDDEDLLREQEAKKYAGVDKLAARIIKQVESKSCVLMGMEFQVESMIMDWVKEMEKR